MAFPANAAEMEQQGYIHADTKTCRGCCAEIEFWITPKGAKIPMDRMPSFDSPAVSHWATCPKAKDFKKK